MGKHGFTMRYLHYGKGLYRAQWVLFSVALVYITMLLLVLRLRVSRRLFYRRWHRLLMLLDYIFLFTLFSCYFGMITIIVAFDQIHMLTGMFWGVLGGLLVFALLIIPKYPLPPLAQVRDKKFSRSHGHQGFHSEETVQLLQPVSKHSHSPSEEYSDSESSMLSGLRGSLNSDSHVILGDREARNSGKRFWLSFLLQANERRGLFLFLAIVFLPLMLMTLVAFRGICVSVHPMAFSSLLSRQILGSPYPCNPGMVCFTYLTLPEDGARSMIVNFHMAERPTSVFAQLEVEGPARTRESDASKDPSVRCSWFKMDNLSSEITRYVAFCDLAMLTPSTVYSLRVGYESSYHLKERVVGPPLRFRTLPASGPVRFIEAGDMGVMEDGFKLLTLSGQVSPDLVVLGGDIAYENGMCTCWPRVDTWLGKWQELVVTPDKLTIPLLTVIGNHDGGGWEIQAEDVSFYTYYFPHQLSLVTPTQQRSQKSIMKERSFHHSHSLSNHSALFCLDTGVVSPIRSGPQKLPEMVSRFPGRPNLMSVHHMAIYPAIHWYTPFPLEDRMAFSRAFDEVGIVVGFEHHVHTFKRTNPIRGGKVVGPGERGTVYVGDGALGLKVRHPVLDPNHEDMFAIAERRNHFWLVECTDSGILLQAMDPEGVVFDESRITTVAPLAPAS